MGVHKRVSQSELLNIGQIPCLWTFMGRYEVEVHIKGEKKEQEQYLATLTIRYTLSIKNNYLTHVS